MKVSFSRRRASEGEAETYCTIHSAASRPAHDILENRLGMMTSHSSQRHSTKHTVETRRSQEQVYSIEERRLACKMREER